MAMWGGVIHPSSPAHNEQWGCKGPHSNSYGAVNRLGHAGPCWGPLALLPPPAKETKLGCNNNRFGLSPTLQNYKLWLIYRRFFYFVHPCLGYIILLFKNV